MPAEIRLPQSPSSAPPPARGGLRADELALLLARARPTIQALFERFHIPADERADLLQEALLALWVKAEVIEHPERWLTGAIRNECRMFWRARRCREALLASSLPARTSAEDHGEEGRLHLRHDVDRLLGRLSTRQRQILRLRYWLGCDPAEVADRLGYRASSMKRLTNRCLHTLRAALQSPELPLLETS